MHGSHDSQWMWTELDASTIESRIRDVPFAYSLESYVHISVHSE